MLFHFSLFDKLAKGLFAKCQLKFKMRGSVRAQLALPERCLYGCESPLCPVLASILAHILAPIPTPILCLRCPPCA